MSENEKRESLNFIEQMIEDDLASGKNSFVQTRFPPEPNGYLHIGHAKSIVLNFGLAEKYNGKCNLRFDDTNPEKESTEYVNAIIEDIKWLGYDYGEKALFTSDYFDTLYEYAIKLIKKGKAYVDHQSAEEISAGKTNPTIPGIESPYRNNSVEQNLEEFEKMRAGEYAEGICVLRAKIDMTSPNMHMRDPIIYRIKKVAHHRTGDKWCIYPNYDFAHGQSDSIENVTYSLCTLEFRDHKPLYDWLIDELEIFPSKQTEFARLNLSYTIVSKRKLLQLVNEGHVAGWDDPRMPTISALRRRGFTPDSLKKFAHKVGVARRDGITDVALLEHSVREDLNKKANRVFGIQNPLKVVITNWPEDKEEIMQAVNNPEDETAGTRDMPFTRELYIEQDDFLENPPSPRKWFRLGPDREVRLKYGYIVKCTGFKKADDGTIEEIYCEYDPDTKSGQDTSGKKVKGTLGWVSAKHAVEAEIRLYDRLFKTENLNTIDDDFINHLNPDSLTIVPNALVEPSLKDAKAGEQFQFERQGYFIVDKESTDDKLVFNRTVTLRDNWSKK
ncbi:glutamine--tRNA ligase/YqeY domain fusion protein [Roseivirga pacifica]|uniref:glutamine--tRNA ligase/YqeY domain fusion protein n=1 Tax=Roseivirga pacifica TaxID=1267423 RepID=UPI0020959E94|nr:glutamine--tRNA ligase/YqeY domain fusion protein [Roseivirga pacifica]MCO6358050.1 glutamine--tRNA ligase/YqeY domain fusion protein [Roseivirga pacifica]MCO6366488.1 glutamine--tRNA ligase/YqeY domain fusion protein [Roseivirga pacifica]MCO6370973.1 glutamine--tRNA ligase/YqeY domain fusion protein [Roseivirga pacifica]MCO6373781.1 glutamine--tRNA ligase/YqeY domain fusion protein [Roseivirga pacifica]MCO6380762.1 glutamine--tRNA ligase/YqeY domain fusion protein [Roseivirga pacifica]